MKALILRTIRTEQCRQREPWQRGKMNVVADARYEEGQGQ